MTSVLAIITGNCSTAKISNLHLCPQDLPQPLTCSPSSWCTASLGPPSLLILLVWSVLSLPARTPCPGISTLLSSASKITKLLIYSMCLPESPLCVNRSIFVSVFISTSGPSPAKFRASRSKRILKKLLLPSISTFSHITRHLPFSKARERDVSGSCPRIMHLDKTAVFSRILLDSFISSISPSLTTLTLILSQVTFSFLSSHS